MRKKVIVNKFSEKSICLAARARVVELLVKLGHEKDCVRQPIASISQSIVNLANNRIRGKLFWLEENTQLGIALSKLTSQDTFNVFAIVFALRKKESTGRKR
jgi:hypothetical protein